MEMTTNRFWLDVINSLKFLWESGSIQHKDAILNTPLWFNPEFRFQHRREWLNKGITMVSDLLSSNNVVISNEDLIEIYSIKVNFIDYHNIKDIQDNSLKSQISTKFGTEIPRTTLSRNPENLRDEVFHSPPTGRPLQGN